MLDVPPLFYEAGIPKLIFKMGKVSPRVKIRVCIAGKGVGSANIQRQTPRSQM